MEKDRIKRFYTLACLIYLCITILYGFCSLLLFLSKSAGQWDTEEAGFLIYAYVIVISPVFYLYEFAFYRLRCASSYATALPKGLNTVHHIWRFVMWALIISVSLIMLAWVAFGLR